ATVGTGGAWLVTRTDVPARRLWRILLPVPLVIPSFIGAFALIAAFAPGGLAERLIGVRVPGGLRGFGGAFLVLTLLTYPYVFLPVAARLQQLPPSLEEAARLLGRPPTRVFASVVLPQIRGAILAGALLTFLYAISDWGAVELLRYDTLTRVIFVSVLDPPTALALSLELGALAVAVVVLERMVTGGVRQVEGVRATRGLQISLGAWRPVATGGLAALLFAALIAPVGVLAFWSVRGLARGAARAGAVVTDPGQLLRPALNTVGISLATAAIAVAVVAPVAYLTVRHRSRAGQAVNAVIVAGFALPGLVIALALTFWTLGAPGPIATAYQTLHLLVAAYVIHFGAQALRAAEVTVASIPRRLDDAARALGAGRGRRLLTVELPLMTPGLLAGGGLVLLSTMKELPATLLLAPPGFDTLATRIWTSAEDAFLADASVASLLLIVLSGVVIWVLGVRRSEVLR
ncbi:MAG: iron ABC transporter permease, partial [Actinomycetota bacterium]|nr:iron ABC transporter permease [Actinomycetota bacterium]